MKKQRLAQIKVPPMTADEKKMWKDYAQARNAKAPRVALANWARKYNVKLKSRNRVELVKSYIGTGAAANPPSDVVAQPTGCDQVCGIRKFTRWRKTDTMRIALVCDFHSCEFDKEMNKWICFYKCEAGITFF